MTPRDVLEAAYTTASAGDALPSDLSAQQQAWLQLVVDNAETHKAVLATVMTSLLKKITTPEQDVRLHKTEWDDGYSGREFDRKFVTKFLRHKFRRLSMKSGSGWLTRSVEQSHPFTLDFPGKIRNKLVKKAFLEIVNDVEVNSASAAAYLQEFVTLLVRHAKASEIIFAANPDTGQLTIAAVIKALRSHFSAKYQGSGASRLPVLAIYSVYAVSMKDEEYADKILLPLKSHTTSDLKSSSVGDVEIVDAKKNFYEAIEVKHNIAITPALVEDALDKFQQLPLERYYLLTTASPNSTEEAKIEELTLQIRNTHGCEVIVNGVLPTIQYYLRRGKRTAAFVAAYTQALQDDFAANTDLKQTHLERWNEILTELNATKNRTDNA